MSDELKSKLNGIQGDAEAAAVKAGNEATPEITMEGLTPSPDATPESIPISRFNEVYGKMKNFERQVDFYKEQTVKQAPFQGQGRPAEEPQAAPPRPPELSDFEYDEGKYTRAVTDYNQKIIDLRVENAVESAFNNRMQQKSSQDAYLKAMENGMKFNERESVLSKTQGYEDYEYIARNPNLINNYPDDMISQINSSDLGPQIAYELGKNEAEALRIARLSPSEIGFELGKIEGRISLNQTPTRRTTKAPPPINTIGSSETATADGKDVKDLTQAELRARLRMTHLADGG